MEFNSVEELLEYTEVFKGKTFGEIDKLGLLKKKTKDKGILGKVIETGGYGYELNSDPAADFKKLGIELKVTGYIKNSRGYRAKERLSLSMIDFCNIVNEEYEFSKLLFKNKKILMVWYEYKKGKKYEDFIITHYNLYDMTQDENVFKNDFYAIKQKVLDGKAHLLSEGDTTYLGACRKGNSGQKPRTQPYSNIPAKSRAFSLKNAYLSGIFQRVISNKVAIKVKELTALDYVNDRFKKYFGLSQLEIIEDITGTSYDEKIPKNIGKMISDRIVGKDSELKEKHDLFSKTNFIIKNTSVDENLYPIERLSFRNLVLSEFEDSWEESDWKQFFEEVTILLICYEGKGLKNGYRRLKEVKQITFTDDDLEMFKLTYNKVQEAINSKDIRYLPYPGSFGVQVIEIAPKGNGGDDVYNHFFDKDITKTCFMLSKEFVKKKIDESK